jgi:hypothetical protein
MLTFGRIVSALRTKHDAVTSLTYYCLISLESKAKPNYGFSWSVVSRKTKCREFPRGTWSVLEAEPTPTLFDNQLTT